MGGMANVVPVQSQDISAHQFRKAGETVGDRGDGSGKSSVELVNAQKTAIAADGPEIGFQGNLRQIALTSGLEKGAPGRMEGVDATYAQSDELFVGEGEALVVVVEGGENAECGLQKSITNENTHYLSQRTDNAD
jgi:hypothetical protein